MPLVWLRGALSLAILWPGLGWSQTCPIALDNPITIPRKNSSDSVKHAYRLPDGSIVFLGRLTIDADGHPRAYGPNNSGLDLTRNAGRPGNWFALATTAQRCGPTGTPIIQGSDDPAPGFFVSKTTMENTAFNCRKQRRYVDSGAIPYVALPRAIATIENQQGKLAVVQRGTTIASALHADQAPAFGIGEGSMKLAQMLGINDNPRTGGHETRDLVYLILPQRMGFPESAGAVESAGRAAFEAWGGAARLNACRTALEAAPR